MLVHGVTASRSHAGGCRTCSAPSFLMRSAGLTCRSGDAELSLTTTTRPARSVPLTSTSIGSPARRSELDDDPWLSCSRLRMLMSVRSHRDQIGTSRIASIFRFGQHAVIVRLQLFFGRSGILAMVRTLLFQRSCRLVGQCLVCAFLVITHNVPPLVRPLHGTTMRYRPCFPSFRCRRIISSCNCRVTRPRSIQLADLDRVTVALVNTELIMKIGRFRRMIISSPIRPG